jgi:hypothetical protein
VLHQVLLSFEAHQKEAVTRGGCQTWKNPRYRSSDGCLCSWNGILSSFLSIQAGSGQTKLKPNRSGFEWKTFRTAETCASHPSNDFIVLVRAILTPANFSFVALSNNTLCAAFHWPFFLYTSESCGSCPSSAACPHG